MIAKTAAKSQSRNQPAEDWRDLHPDPFRVSFRAMQTSRLDVLVIGDLHYPGLVARPNPIAARRGEWMPLFIQRAITRLRQMNAGPDLILLLGDLVNDGEDPGAETAWMHLAGALLGSGIPVLAVAGNHDTRPGRVAAFFNTAPGLHRIGGYGFLVFNDRHTGDDHFVRDAAELALPRQAAAANPGLPLIALQHNPLHPAIDSSYPFLLDNAEEAAASYREAGVALSLSGHYHRGLGPFERDGTTYLTVPALCESPFSFLHLRLDGGRTEITRHALRHDTPGLCDVHCHSEFAYCATTVTAAHGIELSRILGLDRVCIVEHAFQLYFPKTEAWSFNWNNDPEAVAAAWAAPGRGRMAAFRAFARAARSPFARVGLEVDLYGDGHLLLAPGDADDWDILIGAVHAIRGVDRHATPQAEAERLFLRDVDALLASPVDVLAHPFRFFTRSGYAKPEHLFECVAERLAASGKAVELNFHTNDPEPAFFRACLDRGVRIACGTDSHNLLEPADLDRHLRFMRGLGVADADLPAILFTPRS